ncbi:MAG: aminotransferase class I/II-fold pyridoxal phosphate-dependent enzyme [Crocinitomicaceae bacterium]
MAIKIKNTATPYFNIGQLRVDYWNRLKIETSELQRCRKDSENQLQRIANSKQLLNDLLGVEKYFAYPGVSKIKFLINALAGNEYMKLAQVAADTTKQLVSDSYKIPAENKATLELNADELVTNEDFVRVRTNHFEVLFIDNITEAEEVDLRSKITYLQSDNDDFTYGILFQKSFQDAMIALLFNHNIQAVVVRYAPPYYSKSIAPIVKPYIDALSDIDFSHAAETDLGPIIGSIIKKFRPELDAYYVTDTSLAHLKDSTIKGFNRIFYQTEDIQELHLTIMQGVADRYKTPFFSALVDYSKKPTGVFHAMPISRGNSVFKSKWISDFGEFYGRNMFLAETSATTGGLDSLLQPTGPLKVAQEMAKDAYGSQYTYFVTNGTSTANKIVMQALVKPKDVVLVDRDCHKSHHYGLVLAGAYPVYLDSYPIEEYSMYGAVPLSQITTKLLELKEAGRLDKVKMLLLTNCTFDGLVYNVEKVMEQVLAIKPDMIFLWDEAWFAFATFGYNYKLRTAMYCAKKLHSKYHSTAYKKQYKEHISSLKNGEHPSLPDPSKVKIRVYATQSTHKTLSSFRQGSMIHIWDEEFRRKSETTFLEAYMTHTSTSPNYQMLASLDVGRRQVQLEGYELVEKSTELAMILRAKINDNPKLSRYFDILTVANFIPDEYRKTGFSEYYTRENGWNRMEKAWQDDEFVLDPTKITLYIGKTGVDGDTFKNKYLMDKFNIQINKTSRNTVLFMTNIGTTRGSVTYLTTALLKIADELDQELISLNEREKEIREKRIYSLTKEVPPLPDFSYFHSSFQAVPGVPGGNLREAYFLAYQENNYEYVQLTDCLATMESGRMLVASTFVIPYPPGFPVLVPGQVVSKEIIIFMLALDVAEIHGYRSDLGLRVFTEKILDRQKTVTSMGANRST